jgi:hypothetical protein
MRRFLGSVLGLSVVAGAMPVDAQYPPPANPPPAAPPPGYPPPATAPPPGFVPAQPPPPAYAPAQAPPPGFVPAQPPPAYGVAPAQAAPEPLEDAPEPRAPRADQRPFLQGSPSLTLTLGSAWVGSNDYFIVGAGLGYYLLDGLEVGLDGAIWLFDSPTIGTLTPQIKYVVHQLPLIKPYIGTFYRHYFVGDDFEDLDSVGARVGIYIVSGKGAYFGIGGLYEHMLDCNENVLECDDWYPELLVGISF